MREIAEEYGRDPSFRAFVINTVLGGVQDRDYEGQARAILAWVQQNIRYVNEPEELLQSPAYTLKVRSADCDDLSILIGAMAYSVALPWRFALAGFRRGLPIRWVEGTPQPWGANFVHVYNMIGWPPFSPTVWRSAEPTIRTAPLGFDVVLHASRGGPGGAAIPEMQGRAGWSGLPRTLRPAFSGWGSEGNSAPSLLEPPASEGWLSTVIKKAFTLELMVAVIQATITWWVVSRVVRR
jgi:hypothetical protein